MKTFLMIWGILILVMMGALAAASALVGVVLLTTWVNENPINWTWYGPLCVLMITGVTAAIIARFADD